MSLQSRVNHLMSRLGVNSVERDLLNGTNRSYTAVTSTPGLSSVYIVRLSSGLEAYHKPFAGVLTANARWYNQTPDDVPINECCAWLLARGLGAPFDSLVPACVLRSINGNIGSLSARKYGVAEEAAPLAVKDLVLAAGFFDALIGQQDRHVNNYRWDATQNRNSLGLIDHGYAFARSGDFFHRSVFLAQRHLDHWAPLVDSEKEALQRLDATGNLMELEHVLPTDRAAALRARALRMARTREVVPLPKRRRWP